MNVLRKNKKYTVEGRRDLVIEKYYDKQIMNHAVEIVHIPTGIIKCELIVGTFQETCYKMIKEIDKEVNQFFKEQTM